MLTFLRDLRYSARSLGRTPGLTSALLFTVAVAAILMPTGFFLSSMAPGATRPNRLVALVLIGAVFLGLGAASLGIALLTG